jgi:hypothetical protein
MAAPSCGLFLDRFFLFLAMVLIIVGWGGGTTPGTLFTWSAAAVCFAVALGYHLMSSYERTVLSRLERKELTPMQIQQKQERIFRFCHTWLFKLLCLFGGYCFLVAWVLGAMFAFGLLMEVYGAMRCAMDVRCAQRDESDWGLWWMLVVLLAVIIPVLIAEFFSTGWVMICSIASGRELLELKRWSLRKGAHVHAPPMHAADQSAENSAYRTAALVHFCVWGFFVWILSAQDSQDSLGRRNMLLLQVGSVVLLQCSCSAPAVL